MQSPPAPKVSVIIPAYNDAAYIRDSIESALSQPGVEVIVVDDGSTDDTPSIASACEGVRFMSIPHSGPSKARNTGILAASGEWMVFLDGDDILLPGAVELLLDTAISEGAEAVSATFTRDATLAAIPREGRSPLTLSGRDALAATLYQEPRWLNSAAASIYRADKVREVMFKEGIYYEDLDFTTRIYPRLARVSSLSVPVYFYRPNPHSIINTFVRRRLDVLSVTAAVMERWADDPGLLAAARSRRLSACFNMYLLTRRREGYRDVARRCVADIKALRRSVLADPRVRLKNKLGILASYLAGPFM